jgi:toxin CptA
MAQAVDLVLKPSGRSHHLLFWVHVLPLALLPMALDAQPALVLVALAIGASWLWVRRHPAFGHGPRAIARITADPQGGWTIANARGQQSAASLLGDSTVLSWVLILNFRTADGHRRTRVLLGDEAAPEALRRLRVRLAAGLPDPDQKNDGAASP